MEEIKEIVDFVNNHPTDKHDEDHADLWKTLLMCCNVFKDIIEKIEWQENINQKIWRSILELWELSKNNKGKINEYKDDVNKLGASMTKLMSQFPKITTMQKAWLLIDGENIIDTIELESGRYLMVKSINPTDWNEYAKLDKNFMWEVIEVSNDQYDIKIDLNTNTEWETATMTVNVDLLFVKF